MQKILLLLSFFLFVSVSQAQEIKWLTMNEALEAQKKMPKKIFIDVYTTWCGPCKLLDKNTFSNKDVANYLNENFYAVKFNAEGQEVINYKEHTFENPNFDPNKKGRNSQHTFATAMQISGYPSLVFLDEKGDFMHKMAGYRTPQQLELFLKMFGRDDHKKFASEDDWQEYQKEFKPTFKK